MWLIGAKKSEHPWFEQKEIAHGSNFDFRASSSSLTMINIEQGENIYYKSRNIFLDIIW